MTTYLQFPLFQDLEEGETGLLRHLTGPGEAEREVSNPHREELKLKRLAS